MPAPAPSPPTKKRKTTRVLTSALSKVSATTVNAILPLLSLWSTWSSLLQNPVDTLTFPLVPAVFMVQTAYIILLLPLQNTISKSKRRAAKIETFSHAIKAKLLPLILSIVLIFPATIAFYTIIILFGAPVTTHTPQTLLTGLHIALLSTYPLSSSIPSSLENIRQLLTLQYHADFDVLKWTYWGGIGTVMGAWLGAVPIPLDWDREWQKWPITIVVGAYCGHAVGLLAAIAWWAVSSQTPKSLPKVEASAEKLE